MKLAYQGYDLTGKTATGIIDAPTRPEAADQLRKQGILATRIDELDAAITDIASGATAGVSFSRASKGSARHLTELASFSRQLSILVSTKTPLVQAMAAVERQTAEGPWRDILAAVRLKVEEGRSLSEAMEEHPGFFSPVCRALVQAGEAGGTLDAMLRNLADLARQQVHIRKSIVGALIYPVVLISVSFFVLIGLIAFVLPRFQDLFKSLGAALPPSTEALITLSTLLRNYWWAIIPALALSVFALFSAARSNAGTALIHRTILRVPRVGPIVASFCTARIARVLGVLLDAKVGMLDALRLTRQSVGNLCYVELLQASEDRVARGENLSDTLRKPGLITPSVTEAVASGERTGQIGSVLIQVAASMDEDNELLIKTLTSLLEPVILTILGLLIGCVAIAMFMPLFDLTAAGAGGAR